MRISGSRRCRITSFGQGEREYDMALNMVAKNRPEVDPEVWTHERTAVVQAAAQDPVVTRIFVNPAIKKAMCREAGSDRFWLAKVRPWWGHDEHFHVQITVLPTAANASSNHHWAPLTDAGTSSILGSRKPHCIRRRRLYQSILSPLPRCHQSAEKWLRRFK